MARVLLTRHGAAAYNCSSVELLRTAAGWRLEAWPRAAADPGEAYLT